MYSNMLFSSLPQVFSVLNPVPPRAAKSGHFVILLCLTPDDFARQRKASGWERVNYCTSVISISIWREIFGLPPDKNWSLQAWQGMEAWGTTSILVLHTGTESDILQVSIRYHVLLDQSMTRRSLSR